MPHLTLEYTGNLPGLDVRQALVSLNTALMDSGYFEGPDIKSRALRLNEFLVGDDSKAVAFAHATLLLLSGRTSEVKATLAQRLVQVLRDSVRGDGLTPVQLTVEVGELERSSYAKVSF